MRFLHSLRSVEMTRLRPFRNPRLLILLLFATIAGVLIPTQFAQANFLANIAIAIFYPAVYAVGAAAQWIALVFLGWSGALFNYVLSPEFNQVPFTKSLFVVQGWTITRNFANMFFMLIMLAIAFSTILRVDVFGINIKKTLPRLVIAALLINFSRVIAGVIIDVGQIMMVTFTHGVTQEGSLATFLYNQMQAGSLFAGPGFLEGWTAGSPMESLKAISSVWFGAIFIGIAAFAFFMLAIMLIVRIVILWLLIIFAPLAWLAFIVPQGAGIWKQWWDMFLKQTFFGAAIGFFMFLAAQMAVSLSAIEQFSKEVDTGIETSSQFLSNTSNLLQYFTIVIMLYISIIAAKKVNNIGVQATFKVLGGAKKIAMPVARMGLGATGFPAAWGQAKQYFQEKRARFEERMGARITAPMARIPGLGGVGEVARKRERAIIYEQTKNKSDEDLQQQMISGKGMEEAVATEEFRRRKMRVSPQEFAKLHGAVKTPEGKRNLEKYVKETRSVQKIKAMAPAARKYKNCRSVNGPIILSSMSMNWGT